MRTLAAAILLAIAVLTAGVACRQAPPSRQYELKGQILEVRPDRNELVIKHEDIKNFMAGMTMPFKVRPPALLDGRKAGELVTATLVVEEVDAYLSSVTRTGEAPLPESPVIPAAPTTLQPGDRIPEAALVNQDGAPTFVSSLKGHPLALTFIYTRCPIPDFCPLMDRNFQAIQQAIRTTPALSNARLLTVTLDPAYDTPAVLKPYAKMRGADPAIWTFLTGDVVEVAKFGEQFGLYIEHDATSSINVIHNLRTAIIDPSGRVVAIHNGNTWTTAELLADLTKAAAASTN
jgi:protein SCO1/2